MRERKVIGPGVVGRCALAVATALLVAVAAQVSSPAPAVRQAQNPPCSSCMVLREIDDPSTGQRWLLMRDPAHLSGPGILVSRDSVAGAGNFDDQIIRLHPVIRAGDRLTVEQSNEKVELRLEGVALSPAAAGEPLSVRLAISGKVVRAVAVSRDRALQIQGKDFWQ